jgi:hypothetical protein
MADAPFRSSAVAWLPCQGATGTIVAVQINPGSQTSNSDVTITLPRL